MQMQRKHIFGFLLIIFFVFSEMYFGEVKADFLFECTAAQREYSHIESQDAMICNNYICTVEMLSGRGSSFIEKTVSHYGCRAGARIFFLFLYAAAILYIFSYFHAAMHMIQFSESYSKAVVLNYIHNQDGKK